MKAELTIEEMAARGEIPSALEGCYLRLGPNPMAQLKRETEARRASEQAKEGDK
ncbi:carotenoid oxygenase family protein [Ensifer sp. IC4062]|nr:carotenoid oxygenase family protein [Ensifer sp. IC4062]MCA1443961.1 carotenoid oxygenase family protein [Ensifer sp. IC4062]